MEIEERIVRGGSGATPLRVVPLSDPASELSFRSEEFSPSARHETQHSAVAREKVRILSKFEGDVIAPFAHYLYELDSNSSVKMAGSYSSRPHDVRAYSDADVVVLSRNLRDPSVYIQALGFLKNLAEEWVGHQREAVDGVGRVYPVFFTEVAKEIEQINLVKILNKVEAVKVVPCHFLYYMDEANVLEREPKELGMRLLKESREISGKLPSENVFRAPPRDLTVLEGAIWAVERRLAEFILNQSFLPVDCTVSAFASGVYNIVRWLGDNLPVEHEHSSTRSILQILDLKRGEELLESFASIEAARRQPAINTLSDAEVEGLLRPALELLSALHYRMANN